MTIQLFRLPQLVLTEVVSLLNPTEIFLLSLCSQKAYRTLQLHIKKHRQLNINIKICDDETAITYREKGRHGTLMKIKRMRNLFGPCESQVQRGSLVRIHKIFGIWVIWTSKNSESQPVLTRILDLFQKELHHVELNCLNFWIVDFLKKRENNLPYLYHSDCSTWVPDKHFFDMLALKVEHFETNGFVHSPFSRKGFGAQQTVRLGRSRYLKIEDLMKMDQVEITLANCCLSNTDVNLFLKHWMIDGGSPKLRLLRISFYSMQLIWMDEVLRDLERYMVKGDGTTKEYKSLRVENPRHNTNKAHYRITSNQELRRPDGGTVIVSWDNELTLLFFPPKL